MVLLLLTLACDGNPDGSDPPPDTDTTDTDTNTDTTDTTTDTDTTPPARETCDGIDNDGDGLIDEDVDEDADSAEDCAADCNPADPAVNPAAPETTDGQDNDCDTLIDEGSWAEADLVITEIMVDPLAALDRYAEWIEVYNRSAEPRYLNGLVLTDGTTSATITGPPTAVPPHGYAVIGTSTDTSQNGSTPVAVTYAGLELLNGGGTLTLTADGLRQDQVTWSPAPSGATLGLDAGVDDPAQNDQPEGWCVATVAWTEGGDHGSPGLRNESCTTIDRDGDGFTVADGDCDETNPAIHPGAAEVPYDGVDDDCEAANDDDVDGDGFRATLAGGDDCDDDDPATNPDAAEVCNGYDDDCDTRADDDDDDVMDRPAWSPDADADAHGDASTPVYQCVAPEGYGAADTDCDDTDPAVHIDAPEVCGNDIDDNCDGGPSGCGITDTRTSDEVDGVISGTYASGYFGWTVTALDDLDGDGAADILVGAPGWSGTYTNCGRMSVYSLLDPATPWLTIEGEASSDSMGQGSSAAGDVDGDGIGDFLVGAPPAEATVGGEGLVWLFSGALSGTISPALASLTLHGEAGSDAVGLVTLTADVDGDGTQEIVASSAGNDDAGAGAGAVYVYAWAGEAAGGFADAVLEITGERSSDYAGRSVAAVDWNGDGLDELAIGSSDADVLAVNAGAVWVTDATGSGTTSVAYADVLLDGGEASAAAGMDLDAGQDVDGDGLSDLLVGASSATGEASGSGAIYVILAGTGSSALTDAYAVLQGGVSGDGFGAAVDFLGDLDGDGEPDAAGGAVGADGGASGAGEVRIFYGPLTGRMTPGGTVTGTLNGDQLGLGVAGIPDQDGDGDDEIAVSAPYDDTGATNGGSVYWLWGGPGM